MISSDDIDIALSTSIHSLQKLGARVPADLKAKLNSWLVTHQQASDTQNLHHFMNFFEAWRAGQYTLALEELHRYFDYSIASKGAAAGGQDDGVKVYYQYALLHLSVLHADFERWEEALGTMEECIATGKWTALMDDYAIYPYQIWLTPIQQEKTKTQLVSTLLFHGCCISAKRTISLPFLHSGPSRPSLAMVAASKTSSLSSKQRPRTGSTGVSSAVPCWRRRSSSSDMCVTCSHTHSFDKVPICMS